MTIYSSLQHRYRYHVALSCLSFIVAMGWIAALDVAGMNVANLKSNIIRSDDGNLNKNIIDNDRDNYNKRMTTTDVAALPIVDPLAFVDDDEAGNYYSSNILLKTSNTVGNQEAVNVNDDDKLYHRYHHFSFFDNKKHDEFASSHQAVSSSSSSSSLWTSHDHDVVAVRTSSSGIPQQEQQLPQRRNLQSCVSSAAALKAAVQKGSTRIRVCTQVIKLGSLNRRRHRQRGLQSRSIKQLKGLAGGIDLSHRSIIFTCSLKQRCILDGEGISRIFYGTNATLMIAGFQFLNASSVVEDALGSGSALTLVGSSQLTLKDSIFLHNNAKNGGGAIMMNNSTLILQNSNRGRKVHFQNNQAMYGGAIYATNNSTIQTNMTSSSTRKRRILQDQYSTSEDRDLVASSFSRSSALVEFKDNSAKKDGGAVHFTGGAVVWNQVFLEENKAASGGAMTLIGAQTIMTNVRVWRNKAQVTGGAFVFQDSTATIVNSSFSNNDSNGKVGAFTIVSSNVRSLSCNFTSSCWSDGSRCEDGSSCGNQPLCGPNITGNCCNIDVTCNVCCNGRYDWYDSVDSNPSTSYSACGPQPCWDDGTWCIVGQSCKACCNPTLGTVYLNAAQCGQ